MAPTEWPWAHLSRQADVIAQLATAVEASGQWRWLEVCCSLASGRGDEQSDVDAGVGYGDGIDATNIEAAGQELVESVGPVADVLVQVMPGRSEDTRRFAVEFEADVQLDLVLMPSARRRGLPSGAIAVVDKDERLVHPWTPPVEGPPTVEEAREWLMLAWWALSDVAKHVKRAALFEAVERLHEAREQCLRLYATGRTTPYPSFGLVSLLDFAPFEVPASLGRTYATPTHASSLLDAALVTADLLDASAAAAGTALGTSLTTSWSAIGRRRLAEASTA